MGWDDTEGIFGICIIPLHLLPKGYHNNNNNHKNINITNIIRCSSSILDMVSNIRPCSLFRIRYRRLQLSSLFIKILDHLVVCPRLLIDLEVLAGLRVEVVIPIFIKE